MDNLQPLLLNNSNDGEDWKKRGIRKSQVLKRQERTKPGSEEIWDFSVKLVQENVEKGNLIDE